MSSTLVVRFLLQALRMKKEAKEALEGHIQIYKEGHEERQQLLKKVRPGDQ